MAAAEDVPMAAAAGEQQTPRTAVENDSTFDLSGGTSAGAAWRGSRYTASTRTFSKCCPAVYPDEYFLPNGMRYPLVWKIKSIVVIRSRAEDNWTCDCVETPGIPSIAQVEQMLSDHAREVAAKKAAAEAASAPTQ